MPPLSRAMLRAALLEAWLGFGLAQLLMLWKGQPARVPSAWGGWILLHVNLLLMGWMVQVALAVAYWILPRLPHTLNQRGRYGLALSAALLLNGGVALFAVGVVLGRGWLQAVGLGAEGMAVLAFIGHSAPRIRPVITRER